MTTQSHTGNEWLLGERNDRVGVGVWFGSNLIRSWEATPEQAAAYELFVRRELWGLTVRPLPAGTAREPLPEPDWWLLVAR